jgi:hypothetical protein
MAPEKLTFSPLSRRPAVKLKPISLAVTSRPTPDYFCSGKSTNNTA